MTNDVGAFPTGYRRVAYDSLGSTNAEALALARAGDPGNVWITTDEQTAGRGRRGRTWAGGRGNVAASLLLINPAPAPFAATLSFVAGVALFQSVVTVAGSSVADRLALKWPNDLLLDQCKVAGILVEGERLPSNSFAVVVGFGVNCVSHPEVSGRIAATDFAERGIDIGTEQLIAALAHAIAAEVRVWNGGAGFDAIRSAWLSRCHTVGGQMTIALDGHEAEGRFEDLDGEGRLILRRNDGRRETFSAGDVSFNLQGR